MRQFYRTVLWLILAVCVLAGGTGLSAREQSADWPQFRGAGGHATSAATGLPLTWSTQDNVLWKTALPGPGASSPIVVGERIFVTCYSGYGVGGSGQGIMDQLKLHVVCVDRGSGEIRWDREVTPHLPEQARIREDHGYASSTPVAEPDRVYVFFGKSGVLAFDFDGNPLWRTEVGSQVHGWGSGASPVLFGDLVIVNASVESESLVALDKRTGKQVWRVRGIRDAWNTPVLVPLQDGVQELVVAMPRKVMGFDPATGDALWSCANDITWYIAPTMVARDGVIWSLGGRSGVAAVALRAGGRGDVTATHRLWTGERGSNVPSPVLHEGYLYWMNENNGIAFCAEAMTGRIVYDERIARAGQVYASPVLADGRLYYVARNGRTFVVAAAPKYELLAVNDLGDGSTFNASPAVAGNRLLLRSDKFLYCLGLK
jgi:outer membrane protein assembly factor BamB